MLAHIFCAKINGFTSIQPLSPEALAELAERYDFFVTGHTRHNVAGQAAGELILSVFQIKFLHKGASDGCKCITVEIREGCKSVTPSTDFDGIE